MTLGKFGRLCGLLVALFCAVAAAAQPAAPKAAHAARYEHGLLWQVSKPGIAPSHVFGTIHVSDPRVLALAPPVRRAFDGSKEFVAELVINDAVARQYFDAAQFTHGETLEALVGASDYERIAGLLQARGFPVEILPRAKPWAVMLNLAVPVLGTENSEAAEILDQQLYLEARARRLPVGELDLVAEQIFLFDEMPMETQVALLKSSLAGYDSLEATTRRAIDAWLKRDLAALWRINAEASSTGAEFAPHQALLEKRLLFDRNIVMVHRMQPALRRGNAFVAVGALHLYGERGVLKLLADEGYRVRRVY